MATDKHAKSELRQQIRQARNAMDADQQYANGRAISKALLQSAVFKNAQHIALYLANDGEPSLDSVFQAAIAAGKCCYLPRVEAMEMRFHLFTPETKLEENRFGIQEPPKSAPSIAANDLDLVCMPLVAYDLIGGRLGMGGGFYDRCFAFKQNSHATSPALIGIAHSAQQVQRVPYEGFDVKINGVVNELGVIEF